MRVVLDISDEILGWKTHSRSQITLTARKKAYKAQLVTTASHEVGEATKALESQ